MVRVGAWCEAVPCVQPPDAPHRRHGGSTRPPRGSHAAVRVAALRRAGIGDNARTDPRPHAP